MKLTIGAALLGVLLDWLFGDPVWLYHPVRLMGKWIALQERFWRGIFPKNKTGERIAGACLVIFIIAASVAAPAAVLGLAYRLNLWAGFAAESFFCYQLLAAKSLKTESCKVCDKLCEGDLPGAREAVSMIVGRDTERLTEEGVVKAAVETVAENTSDGVIAPLFYMIFGGTLFAFAYKAVNTMDSMVGYKNEKYRWFGTAAARLDDIANYIPARLSGIFLICAAFLTGEDGGGAFRIFCRDRRRHASPNSAQTEAAVAGALRIQLAGDAWYFGALHRKPTIGDALRPVEPEDIRRANRMMYAAELLAFLIFAAARVAITVAIAAA